MRDRQSKVDSVLGKISKGWRKFRDFIPLLTGRGLPGNHVISE